MLYSLLESKRFQDYIKIPRVHKNVKENYYGNFNQTLMARRSLRAYEEGKTVEKAQIEELIRFARWLHPGKIPRLADIMW